MPRADANGGADLGAHMAVLDGDVARSLAHQTSQRTNVAALNQSRYVKVADGGIVGVVERSTIALTGRQIERQRLALSVERTLERVIARASHLRRFNVCGKFHGLAAEAVGCQAAIQGEAEPVPAFIAFDDVGITILLKMAGVGFRERSTKGDRLTNHGKRVGAITVVGNTIADAIVCFFTCQSKRINTFSSKRVKENCNWFTWGGYLRTETELWIITF